MDSVEWLLFLSVPFFAVYFYFKYGYTYWSRKSVETIEEPSFPFGNGKDLIFGKISIYEYQKNIYNKLKGSYGGIYMFRSPMLILKDLEIIKAITVKDFSYFQDRGMHVDTERNPLSAHLFSIAGQKWKNLRQKLTPTFTSGKMKMMFQTIVDCGEELNELLKSEALQNNNIEIKEFASRYTTDVIASTAFGIQGNSIKNPDSEFRSIGKKILNSNAIDTFRTFLAFNAPFVLKYFPLRFSNSEEIQHFIINIVKETVEYREKNNVTRNDFLQLLIQLKNKGTVDTDNVNDTNGYSPTKVPDEEVFEEVQMAAQVFVFFIAGFETSSSTIQFCLYELATNPEIQTKLQEEIDVVLERNNGKVTYDSIQEMEYLDMVVAETLRKHPPLAFLNRECVKDYKMPDSNVLIEKGTKIMISIMGLHHDPKYFPNPEKFEPDRFSTVNKAKRNPYCYMPFGEGPRNCIGSRMGKMQSKVGIISIIKNYTVSVCEKTEVPFSYSNAHSITSTTNPIILKISMRTSI